MSKKKHVCPIDFLLIFSLASKNEAKINVFSNLQRKRRFCENRAPVDARARFSRFGASKNRPNIGVQTHSKKTSEKCASNIDFRIHFGLPKPPKSLLKAMRNEACFATLWNSRGNRRNLTGAIGFGLPKWLCIWLGLLDLLLVALIIKVKSFNLKCFTKISPNSMWESIITASGGTKVNAKRVPRASKSIQKAALKQ